LQDTVDSILQGKVLSIYNFPSPRQFSHTKFYTLLYDKLHAFNVEGLDKTYYVPSRNPKLTGWHAHILFATEEEAGMGQAALDGQILVGCRTRVQNSLVGHKNRSRDEIWKIVHGKYDRTLWDPPESVV
jgi:hypothetical protein